MNNPELIEQEFTPTLNNKLLYVLLALIQLSFAFIFGYASVKNETTFKLVIIPVFSFFSVLMLLKAFSRRLIISGNSITHISFFRKKVLSINAIKGFRHRPRFFTLVPTSAGLPSITVDYSDLTQSDYLLQWIKNNFTDLDAVDEAEEKLAFEQDSSGNMDAQKMKQLENAEMVASVYNVISAVTLFIALVSPGTITDGIKLLIPIAGLVIMLLSRKMIRFTPAWGKSIYPSVGFGILMPCVLLFLNMAIHYNWLDTGKLLIYSCLLAVAFGWFVYKVGWNKLVIPTWTQVFFIVLVAFFFAPGAVVTINCGFDTSKEQVYYSKVLEKHFTSGDGPNYHLVIAAWHAGDSGKKINVNNGLYAQAAENETIEIKERNGLLGIHWFVVNMPEDNLIKTKQ